MNHRKSLISLALAALMLLSLATVGLAEPATIDFWHLWTGHEAENVESMVADFNALQGDVVVVPLSVPDTQKITVAIASGTGPDVSDDFSSSIASYANKGILMPLDDFIAADGTSLEDFAPATLEACRYDGKLYALPLSMNLMALYYNKDLFEAAGLQPPATDVELLAAAKALTTLNDDGTIDVLGFPDFPNVYYLNNFMYAFGGENFDGDMNLTPDNAGTRRALELIVEYRKEFGVENVIRFNSGGKYLDPTDPFLAGKQALRIDGPWLGTTLDTLGIEINYGIIPIPHLEGHPEQAATAPVSCSVAYIPSNAKNPKAAWEFLKYWCIGEGAFTFMQKNANFPALYSLMASDAFEAIKDFEEYAAIATSPNLKVTPVYGQMNEYTKIISDEAELAMSLDKSVDDALAAMLEQAKNLE